MIVVIFAMYFMQQILDFASVEYAKRELFSSTMMYIFIFSLLTSAPFNSVLSRYMSDTIYREEFDDVRPCYYIGLLLNIGLSALLGIPFCIHEYFVGGVDIFYIFTGYCGYISLVFVFYSMLYLSICKEYKKISFYFTVGMIIAILSSILFCKGFHWGAGYSMLLALTIGFLVTACLEFGIVQSYFVGNSRRYKSVLLYFKQYWKLVFSNLFYILGLFVHNFVFWSTPFHMIVRSSFVSMTSYDMATCLAMFTNISASVIFISRVEMHFHERYKAFSESIINGRGEDIEITKIRMFRRLAEELMNLARIQFIITMVIFLIGMIALPQFGFGGMTMRIYPCLTAGYFILFLMYAEIIFLYYLNDTEGSLLTAVVFFVFTLVGSLIATNLSEIWYGLGVVIGSFIGWSTAYMRLHWLEQNFGIHTFCEGSILKKKKEACPSSKVFDRYQE